MIQIVNFDTWSRIINGVRKSSILDHVYVNNLPTITNVVFETPVFGDHVLVVVNLTLTYNNSDETNALKRDWRKYSKLKLISGLSPHIEPINAIGQETTVAQEFWNVLENVIISVIDVIAPIGSPQVNKLKPQVHHVTKKLLNRRKRFIQIDKIRGNNINAPKIKVLNLEIRQHFATQLKSRVRSAASGNNANLWRAVKMSKECKQ